MDDILNMGGIQDEKGREIDYPWRVEESNYKKKIQSPELVAYFQSIFHVLDRKGEMDDKAWQIEPLSNLERVLEGESYLLTGRVDSKEQEGAKALIQELNDRNKKTRKSYLHEKDYGLLELTGTIIFCFLAPTLILITKLFLPSVNAFATKGDLNTIAYIFGVFAISALLVSPFFWRHFRRP